MFRKFAAVAIAGSLIAGNGWARSAGPDTWKRAAMRHEIVQASFVPGDDSLINRSLSFHRDVQADEALLAFIVLLRASNLSARQKQLN
jgi:hypothetical protein